MMYILFQEKHILLQEKNYTRKWPGLCKSVFMITFIFNLVRPKYRKNLFYFQKEIGIHASIVLYFDFITCLSLVTY